LTDNEKNHLIAPLFTSQFPDFALNDNPLSPYPTPNGLIFAAEIRGVPQLAGHSLDSVAQVMIRSHCESFYQVWTTSRKPAILKRQFAKRRYQSTLGKSQRQETIGLDSRRGVDGL
jgi:hypothetical protein